MHNARANVSISRNIWFPKNREPKPTSRAWSHGAGRDLALPIPIHISTLQ
jgi:hypothetical protein